MIEFEAGAEVRRASSALKWTTKTFKQLREALRKNGFRASITAIADVFKALGYWWYKTKESAPHSDRNAHFEYINATIGKALKRACLALYQIERPRRLIRTQSAA